MTSIPRFLNAHKFKSHSAAFLLMVLPPLPMYFAAQRGATTWIAILLGFVVLGNLLELLIE